MTLSFVVVKVLLAEVSTDFTSKVKLSQVLQFRSMGKQKTTKTVYYAFWRENQGSSGCGPSQSELDVACEVKSNLLGCKTICIQISKVPRTMFHEQ